MRPLLLLLVLVLSSGCGDSRLSNWIDERRTDYWEGVIKKTSSVETLFEASYHLNYSFPEEFVRVGKEKSYQFLITKLKSAHAKERDNAATCLRGFHYGNRNAELVAAYKRETVLDVKLGLLFAMCNPHSSPEIVELLTSVLKGNDNNVRWSAVRSLSVVGLPETDELLARYAEDPDPRVRQEIARNIKAIEESAGLTAEGAVHLMRLAANLVKEDPSDRIIPAGAFPSIVGTRKVKDVRLRGKVLWVRLSDPDAGLIIQTDEESELPELPEFGDYWVWSTRRPAITRYERWRKRQVFGQERPAD